MYRKEEIDLSLNQPLCDLIATYWQAFHARIDHDVKFEEDFHVLEDYLCNLGVIFDKIQIQNNHRNVNTSSYGLFLSYIFRCFIFYRFRAISEMDRFTRRWMVDFR